MADNNVSIGAKTITWYSPITTVELWIYATQPFVTEAGTPINSGSPTDGLTALQPLTKVACTIDGTAHTCAIAALTLTSTEDADVNNTVTYIAVFVNTDKNRVIAGYSVFGQDKAFRLPTDTPTTWGEIAAYNAGGLASSIPHDALVTGDFTVDGDITVNGNTGIVSQFHGRTGLVTLQSSDLNGLSGAGLTGIGTGTGGVINTGSTTIGADSDADTVGVIDFQIGGVSAGQVQNDGTWDLNSKIDSGTVEWLSGGELDMKRDYGAIGDGATNALSSVFGSLAAAQARYPLSTAKGYLTALTQQVDWAATQEAMLANKPARWPEGQYIYTDPLKFISTATDIFSPAPSLFGAGSERTILDHRAANSPLFEFDTNGTTEQRLIRGIKLQGFKVTGEATNPANADGFSFRHAYDIDMTDILIDKLTGSGVYLAVNLGDLDGCNQVKWQQCRIRRCSKWGIDCDTGAFNELSFLELEQTFLDTCGTAEVDPTFAPAAVNTSTGVLTIVAHEMAVGQVVRLSTSGTLPTGLAASTSYAVVSVPSADTLTLSATAGGSAIVPSTQGTGTHTLVRPPMSGGMRWKGQVLTLDQATFVLNENVGLFMYGGSGLSNTVMASGTVFENNHKRALKIQGLHSAMFLRTQIYQNNDNTAVRGIELDGAIYAVQAVEFNGIQVRVSSGNNAHTAFDVSGGNALNNLVDRVLFQDYDHAGQVRVVNTADASNRINVEGYNRPYPEGFLQTTMAASGTYTPDADVYTNHILTLPTASGTYTIANPTTVGGSAGKKIRIELYNSSAGWVEVVFGSLLLAEDFIPPDAGERTSAFFSFDAVFGWTQTTGWSKSNKRLAISASAATVTGSTTETDLQTKTVPPNTFPGYGLRLTASGTTAGTAGNKTIKLYHNTTQVAAIPAFSTADEWTIEAVMTAAGSATQRWTVRAYRGGALVLHDEMQTLGESNTAASTIKLTGQLANAADTISQVLWMVERI